MPCPILRIKNNEEERQHLCSGRHEKVFVPRCGKKHFLLMKGRYDCSSAPPLHTCLLDFMLAKQGDFTNNMGKEESV